MKKLLVSLAVLALAACATTTTTGAAARETAYAAQTTADIALKAIPGLLQTRAVSVSTAIQIKAAADAVSTEAQSVYACTTATATAASCTTTQLTSLLATLAALMPPPAAPVVPAATK